MRVPGIRYVQGRNDYTDHDGLKFGIAIHNTSNDASDEGEASYAQRRTDGVSSHFYCDDNSVTQSIDTDDRVGHAGSNIGNNNALAVEITGANGWSRQKWLTSVAWNELGRVLAYVITHDPDLHGFQVRRASVAEMKTNPRVRAFYSHDDMRRAWGGTTHTDPGPNFPWDRLFQVVNAHLSPEEEDMTPDQARQLRDSHYVVARVSWPNPAGAGSVTMRDWATWMTGAVKALAVAVGGVDEATKAQLEQDFNALSADVKAIPAATVDELGVEEDPQVIADRLRAALGEKAAAVGAILAAG